MNATQDMQREKRGTERTAAAALAAFVLLMPLAFSWSLYDTYDLTKFAIFEAGALGFILIGLLHFRSGFRRLPLDGPVAAFVAVYGVAAVFSIDRSLSFWGQYRSYVFGWLAMALGGLLYRSVAELRTDALEDSAVRAAVFAGALAGIYGVAQYFGIEFPRMPNNAGGAVWSSFGNPVYFGAYCMMVLPPAVALAERSREEDSSPLFRFLYAATAAAVLAGLVLSRSRGAWGGAVAGLAVYFGVRGRSGRKAALILLGAAVFSILLSAPLRVRLVSVFRPQGADFARFEGWKLAFKIFAAHPLTGTGPDTFGYAFRRVRSLDYIRATGAEEVHAQAHDDLLQYAATAGVLGAASFLWLWIALFRLGWSRRGSRLGLALFSSLCTLFVQNISNFWSPATFALFWIFAGFLSAGGLESSESGRRPSRAAKGAAFAAWVAGVIWIVRPVLADAHFMRGLSLAASREDQAAVGQFRSAVNLNPRIPEYARRLSELLRDQARSVDIPGIRGSLLEQALAVSQAAASARPQDPDSWNNLGVSQMWMTEFAGIDRRSEARNAFEKAVELDPLFVDAWSNLAKVAHFDGDTRREIDLWKKVLEIQPDRQEARRLLLGLDPEAAVKEGR